MMARLVRLEVALLTLAAVLAVGIAVALVRLQPAPRLAAPAPAVIAPTPTAVPAAPAVVAPMAAPWTWPTWLPLAGLLAGGLLLAFLLWRARQPLRRVAQRVAARHAVRRAVVAGRPAPPPLARRRVAIQVPLRRWMERGQMGIQRLGRGMQERAQQLATQLAAVQVPTLPRRVQRTPTASAPAPVRDQPAQPGPDRAVLLAAVEADAALPPVVVAASAEPPLTLPPALDPAPAVPPVVEEELPLAALHDAAPAPLPDLRAVVVPSAPPAVSALDRAQQAAVLLATGWATHGLTQPVLRLSADPKDGTVLVHLAPGAADDPALAGWLGTVGGSWRDGTTLRLPVADVALGLHQPPVLLPIATERSVTHFWPLATYGALGIYGAEAVPLALAALASALFQASPDALALYLVDPSNRLRPALADVPHTLVGLDDATVLAQLPAALWQPLPLGARPLVVVLVAPDAATLAALAPVYRRLRRMASPGLALLLVCPTLDLAGRDLYPVLPALVTGASSGEAAWLPGHTWAAAGRVRGWSPQQDWTAPLPPLDEGLAQQLLAGVRGAPCSAVPTVLAAGGWTATPARDGDGVLIADVPVAPWALPAAAPAAVERDDSWFAPDVHGPDAAWPAGAGLEPAALAAVLTAALAESAATISRKGLNAIVAAQGVRVNQGVIAKQLLRWLADAGVIREVSRAPARWCVTDLAEIAQRLTETPAPAAADQRRAAAPRTEGADDHTD